MNVVMRYDQTDYLSYKAYLVSDQDWFNFIEEIDEAIEKSGPTTKDKESATHITLVTIDEINNYDFAPADVPFVNKI